VFPGFLRGPELVEAYRASRCFLLTSRVEGLPMVAVEAMSLGLPAVVTAVGELPWLVRDGVEGRVVPREAEAIAGALVHILADEPARQAMAVAAKERVRSLAEESRPEAIAEAWRRMLAAL